jgi:phosphatidylserine/phosphatidylglycerophosphate/cardiolipin synthase-like enzyme
VDFVWETPGKNTSKGMWGGGKTTTALMDLIKGAKKSVVIQTPYLVTSELRQGLFANAIKRGVSVTILTISLGATDNLMAFNGYRAIGMISSEWGLSSTRFVRMLRFAARL